MTRHARSRPRRGIVSSLLVLAGVAGCSGPLANDYVVVDPPQERLQEIERVRLEERSTSAPMDVDAASSMVDEASIQRRVEEVREEPADRIELTLEEVRATTLAENLDLKVDLLSPSIAQTSVDEAEAQFESVFTAAWNRAHTDAPVALATEGSQVDFDRLDFGVRVPLRTGGTFRVDMPMTKTDTNNPFALLNPSYTNDIRFSISQPLLRGAGQRANTHSIRVAKYQQTITTAQTKLEAIRVLANADRGYWSLYAAQRALDVAIQQYELAREQLEEARAKRDAGVVAEIDVIRAASGMASRLEAIIVADNEVKRRQRDLKRLMNRDDLPMESPTAIILTTDPDPVLVELDPLELADFAVVNRMEMLELELQLAIDVSAIDLARNQKLPLITLDYTYSPRGLGATRSDAWSQLTGSNFVDWSVGLRAEIPIGNEAAKASLHRAVLQRLQRLATREQRDQSIRQEVYDAIDALNQNWLRILAARQDALFAGRTLLGEQNQYEQGARTTTEVLDAAARLADAQLSEIRALTDYQIAQIDIAVATGTLLGYGRVRWEAIDVEKAEY